MIIICILLAVLVIKSGAPFSNESTFESSEELTEADLEMFEDDRLTKDGCGEDRGCWFQPEGCEIDSNAVDCVSAVQWQNEGDGIVFEFQGRITDLNETHNARYIALGFSKDDRMGDDTVIECVFMPGGDGRAYVSFNDGISNEQLLQATEVMFESSSARSEDGRMTCKAKWMFAGRERVFLKDRFKVFDLESRTWTLQIARGYADSRSGLKKIHSTLDGPLFPWLTSEKVFICFNCITEERYQYVRNMKQTDVSRFWRYRLAVIHGILLLFAWWVCGSSAILISRFFKPMWQNRKLFDTAVWFQLHRDILVISIVLQVIAVFIIFLQAGFTWYGCTFKCDYSAHSLKLHVILGFTATVSALIQPIVALLRPGISSNWRPIFNWIHWFIGTGAWLLATITIFLSAILGKTGLYRNFGRLPYNVMGAYLAVYISTTIFLEMIVSRSENKQVEKPGHNEIELFTLSGPTKERPTEAKSKLNSLRPIIFLIHLIAALGAWIWLSYMLIWNLNHH